MEVVVNFIKTLIFEGNTVPKLFIIMWVSIPFILSAITFLDEKKNQNQYKYYKNDIYKQWRKFK